MISFEQNNSMLGLELTNDGLDMNFDDFNSAMMALLRDRSDQWCQEKTDIKEYSTKWWCQPLTNPHLWYLLLWECYGMN